MKCEVAIDRMLEADLEELVGEADTELALHIQQCRRCQMVADRIVKDQQALAKALEIETPRTGVDEALRIAATRAVRRRNRFWQVGAPLAAAASITAMMLLGGNNAGFETIVLPQATVLPGFEVSGPPGKDVAVFEVADRPDIVVVWFFDAGENIS